MRSKRFVRELAAGFVAAAAVSFAAGARADDSVDYDLARMGELYYRNYCASCHGLAGRGDGPFSVALKTPPADLTRIAARRGGSIVDGEIAMFIDGRFEVRARGAREMPTWGERFAENVPEAGVGESLARGKVAVLVEYLKSIQERNGTGGGRR